MQRPTLFLTVAFACTGKTTAARRLEIEHSALHLTKDQWSRPCTAVRTRRPSRTSSRGALVEIGLRALELGTNVVIYCPMSDERLAEWAVAIEVPTPGERDGSEPVDEPPAGFATWEAWRRHRWSPSVSGRVADTVSRQL